MKQRRIWLSMIAVLLVILSFSQVLDEASSQSTEKALVRALATYGVARALNGVISVAQGTELAIEPAGVGVILTPGQILDPINDLVERFSWVMLVSSASLGVLNVLLSISIWFWLSVILTIALAAAVALQWRRDRVSDTVRHLVTKGVLLLILIRFAAPVVAITNDLVYTQFLESRYQSAMTELQQTTSRIDDINRETHTPSNPVSDRSWLDRAKTLIDSASSSIANALDIEARMKRYEAAASDVSRYTIDLIVIFVFQTIFLPIFFIWFVWQMAKWIMIPAKQS